MKEVINQEEDLVKKIDWATKTMKKMMIKKLI